MRRLQEWMGHRDFVTTLIYADFAPNHRLETAWVEEAFASEPAMAPIAEPEA
jgi:site-specific recombinase XerD